ncbi:hypothetical protein GE09DRAFT_1162398 [Coniochaeta sp. 2T2.1]|nr:hypothetical protein GE09DRAFT_1162398 [Coniochaeta sp. 2T2.1]
MASHDNNLTTTYRTGDGSRNRFNLSDPARINLVAFLAEFVGTFMFLFLAFAGTQVAVGIRADDFGDPERSE